MNKKDFLEKINIWCDTLEKKSASKKSKYNLGDIDYFWFKINKKYTKIVKVDGFGKREIPHALIDNKTLDVYKPASKKARYNLANSFNKILSDCDIYGRYLYERSI
jgi:hypothetical protein